MYKAFPSISSISCMEKLPLFRLAMDEWLWLSGLASAVGYGLVALAKWLGFGCWVGFSY
jgi:hypothetical protein